MSVGVVTKVCDAALHVPQANVKHGRHRLLPGDNGQANDKNVPIREQPKPDKKLSTTARGSSKSHTP